MVLVSSPSALEKLRPSSRRRDLPLKTSFGVRVRTKVRTEVDALRREAETLVDDADLAGWVASQREPPVGRAQPLLSAGT